MDSCAGSCRRFAVLSGSLLLLLAAAAAGAAPQLSMSTLGYRIEKLEPVAGAARMYDLTARAGVANTGDTATAVTARLDSATSSVIVLDGDLSFGTVGRTPTLRPVISQDTFRLRIILPKSQSLLDLLKFAQTSVQALSWTLSCGNCMQNRPPVANAGAGQTVYVAQLVELDGSASVDPDGQPLTFRWSMVSRPEGSSVHLSSASAVRPTFVADRDGTYVFQLVVNDGTADSAPAAVTITTLNSPPVAQAGPDRTARVGTRIELNGAASSDVDGDTLIYEWSLSARPVGSAATLLNADPASPLADFMIDKPGEYVVQLVVNDGTTDSSADIAIVSTINSAPVADAGPDRTATVGATLELSGAASFDVDADPLSYRWSLTAPAGSQTTLLSSGGIASGFVIDKVGLYVAQLIVNDGVLDSAADTVAISTVNSVPVAHVGSGQTVDVNTVVTLDGSGSHDADSDPLSFNWSLSSVPPGSAAELSDPHAIQPTMTPDLTGPYVGQLIVNDGTTNSAPATVTITARDVLPPPPLPPPTDIEPPAAARADAISVMRDEVAGVLTVLGTAGSVEPGVQVIVSDFATGEFVTVIAASDGSFVAMMTAAQQRGALLVTVRDAAGNSSASVSVGATSALELTIETPLESQRLSGSVVLVAGELNAPENTGVLVNGKPAAVLYDPDGSSFETQVELLPPVDAGELALPVSIEVAAHSPDGRRVSEMVTVKIMNFSAFALQASPADGPAPLQTAFRIQDNHGRGISRIELDADGDGISEVSSTDADVRLDWLYSEPGTYVAIATITDHAGATEQAAVPVHVYESVRFAATLRSIWNEMTAALTHGNSVAAGYRLTGEAQAYFAPVFSTLNAKMPQIMASLSGLHLVEATSDVAEFLITRTIDGEPHAYFVHFMRDGDGVWRIAGM